MKIDFLLLFYNVWLRRYSAWSRQVEADEIEGGDEKAAMGAITTLINDRFGEAEE